MWGKEDEKKKKKYKKNLKRDKSKKGNRKPKIIACRNLVYLILLQEKIHKRWKIRYPIRPLDNLYYL